MGRLRGASPALSFEELSRILAQEWDGLSEVAKTPYKDKADKQRGRYEAMSAALVLTQIGTPSFQSGPTTPVPLGRTAKRCLDISTPDWQAASSFGNPILDFGYPKGLLDTLSLAEASPSATSPAGKFSTGGTSAGIDRAEGEITPMTPMTLLETLAAGQSPDPTEGSAAKKAEGQEFHPPSLGPTGGSATKKAEDQAPHPPADEPGPNASKGKKRKASSAPRSTTAPKQRSKSTHKAACRAGREIVARMSKKDPARPKYPQSSYMMFYTERVVVYKMARPNMAMTDLGRVMGEAWRSLPAKDKVVYTERAKADRERYERDLCNIAQAAATSPAPAPWIATP